jgi:N-acetylglucosaminyl-diphospho-decaprenol L-rhamnosyltransferase
MAGKMISDLTIVSVSYNSADVFSSYWEDFLDNTWLDVIIVDNASPDGSGSILAQKYPKHRVIQMDRNVGFGRAANEGFINCRSRFVLLLNPDLRINERGIVDLYNIAISDPDNTAIWAPVVTRPEFLGTPPEKIDKVSGAAMLFDLEKMQQVGLFDENIFLYSEESDLCYRTRLKGYEIKLCPRIFFEHMVGGSSGHHPSIVKMKSWHFAWSRCYYLHKHGLYTAKRNPSRMLRNYRLKSFLSMDKIKRLRYRGQAAGVKAFLKGKTAFIANGKPQKSPG